MFSYPSYGQRTLNQVTEENCLSRNSFSDKNDYSEYFAYKGNSTLHRLNYNEDNVINSAEDFIQYLGLNSDYTFRVQSNTTLNGSEITRYQQFYQDMEVEPGGFAFIGGDPCNTLISAFVYSEIDDFEESLISESDLPEFIGGHIIESNLVIIKNPNDDCSFKQAWRVKYEDEQIKLAWVDSQNGSIIRMKNFGDNGSSLNSDGKHLVEYSSVKKKETYFSEFEELENSSVLIYNHKDCAKSVDITSTVTLSSSPNTELICNFEDNENLETLNNNFIEVVSCLEEVGITLAPANVLVGCTPSAPAIAFSGTTDPSVGLIFQFGSQNIGNNDAVYLPFYSTDVIAHEYGHHFLNPFFTSSTSIHHAVIHEYFADLFSLFVNTEGCENENDFALSNLDGGIIRDFTDFDFDDPCQYDVNPSTFNTGNPHFYGAPFRYLTYQIVDNGILTLEEFFDTTTEVLSTFPNDGTVLDLANLYISNIISRFGPCSSESDFIADLAVQLCLSEPFFPCDVIDIRFTTPTTDVIVEGVTLSVCENVHNGEITLEVSSQDLDPNAVHRWSGIRPEWIVNNQTNNTSPTDAEITIKFPKYNFYPRKYTICNDARASERSGCVTIVLRDCDNNDPTCEEVFADFGNLVDTNVETRSSKFPIVSQNIFEVYDLSGKLITTGDLAKVRNNLSTLPKQIFFILELNETREYLKTYKYINQ